jgi:hypothetical protein
MDHDLDMRKIGSRAHYTVDCIYQAGSKLPSMLESEMEELLALYPHDFFPRKMLVLTGRQKSFSGVGRFDLLFEDEHQSNILIELKARVAKYEDASQVAKYKAALDEQGKRNVIMWLVATHIPKPVIDFLDSIGIEHTEIHETEYRNVASRHNFTFASDEKKPSAPRASIYETLDTPGVKIGRSKSQWSLDTTHAATEGPTEFLARCEDNARAFFATFFDHQKTLSKRTQITWKHQSGFSMKIYFKRLGYVELIWGFPAVNREGASSGNRQSLVFPLDFASRRNVPNDFLNGFVTTLSEGVHVGGGLKRPSIAVSALSPAEVEYILNTVSAYVEKAGSI